MRRRVAIAHDFDTRTLALLSTAQIVVQRTLGTETEPPVTLETIWHVLCEQVRSQRMRRQAWSTLSGPEQFHLIINGRDVAPAVTNRYAAVGDE